MGLCHRVQSRTILEPLNLGSIEGVCQLDVESLSIFGVHSEGHWLANLELCSEQINLVVWLDLVVVRGVNEGQWKHTLLLQVGFVDTGKRADDDGNASQMSGFQCSVFSRTTFSVIPVTNDYPRDALLLVVSGSGGNSIEFSSGEVLNLICLTIGGVGGTNQHVVRDVVKMSTVFQPRAGHRNVIRGSLSLALDEDGNIREILAIPCGERLKKLKSVASRRNGNADGVAFCRRGLVGILSGVISS